MDRKSIVDILRRDAEAIYWVGASNPRGVSFAIYRHLYTVCRSRVSAEQQEVYRRLVWASRQINADINNNYAAIIKGDAAPHLLALRYQVLSCQYILETVRDEIAPYLRLMVSQLGHLVGARDDHMGHGSYPGVEGDLALLHPWEIVDPWGDLEMVGV